MKNSGEFFSESGDIRHQKPGGHTDEQWLQEDLKGESVVRKHPDPGGQFEHQKPGTQDKAGLEHMVGGQDQNMQNHFADEISGEQGAAKFESQ